MRKQGCRGYREASWDELLDEACRRRGRELLDEACRRRRVLLDEACRRRRVLSHLLSILSRSLSLSRSVTPKRSAHSPTLDYLHRLCTSKEY